MGRKSHSETLFFPFRRNLLGRHENPSILEQSTGGSEQIKPTWTQQRLPDSQTCEKGHSKTSFSKFFSKPTRGWLVLRKQDPGYHEARLGANLAFTH